MPEPTSASIITYFSIAKLWSIVSGVCGSIIPILALADKTKITIINGFFMALTGSSFSVFVGPWLSEKFSITSIEGIVALSWIMGASGVYLVRAVLKWLDERGVQAIDGVVNKAIGIPQQQYQQPAQYAQPMPAAMDSSADESPQLNPSLPPPGHGNSPR